MTPLDQAITALHDIQYDLDEERQHMKSAEGHFAMPHVIAHVSAAEQMLKRIRTDEDAAHEGLFDQEGE